MAAHTGELRCCEREDWPHEHYCNECKRPERRSRPCQNWETFAQLTVQQCAKYAVIRRGEEEIERGSKRLARASVNYAEDGEDEDGGHEQGFVSPGPQRAPPPACASYTAQRA